ncbi:MAG: class I SAM-dependent methyltransferase [Candidatus Dormibacteria bacterium]
MDPPIIATERMLGLGGVFRYRRCQECGTLQLMDPPPDLSRYYPGEGYYANSEGSESGRRERVFLRVRRIHARHHIRRWNAVGQAVDLLCGPIGPAALGRLRGVLRPDTPILDVGCGPADWLHAFAELGHTNLLGIDPHLGRDQDLHDGRLRLRRAGLEETEGTFGLVILNHSLEHMPDPPRVFVEIAKRLRPGGHVVIRTPVPGRAFEEYGADWVQLDPPRHLFIHTPAGIARLADQAGLALRTTLFDSTLVQFTGSIRYQRGLTINAPLHLGPSALIRFALSARRLNREGQGDQAVFILSAR